jgi:hypothetical protein
VWTIGVQEGQRDVLAVAVATGVMPGEHRGCVGCHEQHSVAPPNRPTLALHRPPDELTPPPWATL